MGPRVLAASEGDGPRAREGVQDAHPGAGVREAEEGLGEDGGEASPEGRLGEAAGEGPFRELDPEEGLLPADVHPDPHGRALQVHGHAVGPVEGLPYPPLHLGAREGVFPLPPGLHAEASRLLKLGPGKGQGGPLQGPQGVLPGKKKPGAEEDEVVGEAKPQGLLPHPGPGDADPALPGVHLRPFARVEGGKLLQEEVLQTRVGGGLKPQGPPPPPEAAARPPCGP